MNYAKTFVYTILVLQVGACAAYGVRQDWKLCLYWAFSTGIISVVTFL